MKNMSNNGLKITRLKKSDYEELGNLRSIDPEVIFD